VAGWGEFTASAPSLATAGRRLLDATGIAFLATVRRDGAPRLHPIVPIISGDGLYVAFNSISPKRHDLRRDDRYALHASLGPDEEFALNATTSEVSDPATREMIIAASFAVHDADALFELRVARCLHTVWSELGSRIRSPFGNGGRMSDTIRSRA
jgi:hypothetical protein